MEDLKSVEKISKAHRRVEERSFAQQIGCAKVAQTLYRPSGVFRELTCRRPKQREGGPCASGTWVLTA
jgi:hypothetical protein